MPDFKKIFSSPVFENSLEHWLIALSVAAAVFVVLWSGRGAVRRYARKMQATERAEFLEIPSLVFSRTTFTFMLITGAYLGFHFLTSSPRATAFMGSLITIAFFWQAGIWTVTAVSAALERKRRESLTADRAVTSSLGIIGFITSAVIWAMVVLLTLDNLGVNITALIAGLGIGGIAVALAVQNILGDLFASVSIALDKPFVVGDFLDVDGFLGSVEYIGIKSTRVRSLSGEQIVMSNADLLKARLRNYGRMQQRRVVFTTGVTYDTPVERIEEIPGLIRSIVEEQKNTRFDRSHFQKHGASSIDFETVYYVLSADFNVYMDIQQAINLKLHREFAARKVSFAFPTQTLIMSRAAESTDQKNHGRGTAARAPN